MSTITAPVTRVVWTIRAAENDMLDAEKFVFPDYTYYLSELDWAPFDEDDERPDNCERSIELRVNDPEHMAGAFKVLGILGSKGRLEIKIESDYYDVRTDTTGNTDISQIRGDRAAAELDQRMNAAIQVLRGKPRPSL